MCHPIPEHEHHWHIDTGNLQHCCECGVERITDKDPIED